MINNEIPLSKAAQASSLSRADQLGMRQTCYDRIRSNFIQQSARYLQSSLNRAMETAGSDGNTLVRS